MKLGPITKLDKSNTTTSKTFDMAPCRQIVTLFSFFQFLVKLQPSGGQIPDAWPIKLKFLLTITFYLKKTENRTKNSLTQLSYYWFE